MCKDLQENKINNMKFHDEIDQFIELFKGQIIGQNFQYVLNTFASLSPAVFVRKQRARILTERLCFK